MQGWFFRAFLFFPLLAPGIASAALSFSIQPSRGNTLAESSPAPLAVMFRTDISDADFLVWHCEWNFGDDDNAEWASSFHASGSPLRKKNRAIGPIAAHVYESPGTYTVNVTCADGSDTGTDQATIIVDDPDAVFPGANTVCASPAGNFAGCPPGALTDTRSDFAAIGNEHLRANKRVLLHRGESWTMSGEFSRIKSGDSNVLLAAYGSGSKPTINGPTSNGAFCVDQATEWAFSDFKFVGQGGDRYFWFPVNCSGVHPAVPTENFLFHELDVSGVSYGYEYEHSGLGDLEGMPANKNLFIVGGSLQASGQYGVFGGHNGGGVMGLHNTSTVQHSTRMMCQLNMVFQHNRLDGSPTVAGSNFRHCSVPNDERSKRILISDNVWGAAEPIQIKPNLTSGTVGAKAQYGIFERNMHFSTVQLMHLQHWVLRNNVCNRGNNSCWQIQRNVNNPQVLQDLHVYNNSQESTNISGWGVVFHSDLGNCASGCSAKNNLVYSTAASTGAGGTVSQVSGVDVSNNLNNPASSPFVSGNPTAAGDFRLNASTAARDGGTATSGFRIDIGWNCRSPSTSDIGAWESAGGTQQCLGDAVPPLAALLPPVWVD
jgi:PKD repeat protein